MKFISENWGFLIFVGIFLYLIVKRGDLMIRKGGCCGGHDHDHGEHHNENHIVENERSQKSCCCSHKEKR